ncbi:Cold shock protein, CspA family [Paracoccus sp. J56]|nr:Cold shock protein, CspA family [Paracoccus sp. J56]
MFSDPVPCGSASIFSFAGPLRYVSGIFERNSTMANGTVKWFNSNKGFGFIAPEAGSKDVFIHISALERAGIHHLNDGQAIAYDIERDRNGRESATNLVLS